jgi:hypothetical protein
VAEVVEDLQQVILEELADLAVEVLVEMEQIVRQEI